jgi:hypothetical protein
VQRYNFYAKTKKVLAENEKKSEKIWWFSGEYITLPPKK